MQTTWSPNSWQQYPNAQPIQYADAAHLQMVLAALQIAHPLVEIANIHNLLHELQQVAKGEAFILQAGECAERFVDAEPTRVRAQLSLLNELSELLAQHLQKPVVTVGRIAGQYAKPRSLAFESRAQLSLENYRGDLINGFEFDAKQRQPDPERLQMAYQNAQQTLAVLNQYASQLYTSHEILHLDYAQSLTREIAGQYYNTATHFPWIGLRTAKPASAHIEYVSGLANPIAIKLGPHCRPEELQALLLKLNSQRKLGRLSLIHRFGADLIAQHLPALIKAAQATDIPVLWLCDPMHGNTMRNAQGHKFRLMPAILAELKQAIQLHKDLGSTLSGIHLELSSTPIQECFNDPNEVVSIQPSYIVDPRLNREQAIQVVRSIKL